MTPAATQPALGGRTEAYLVSTATVERAATALADATAALAAAAARVRGVPAPSSWALDGALAPAADALLDTLHRALRDAGEAARRAADGLAVAGIGYERAEAVARGLVAAAAGATTPSSPSSRATLRGH